MVIRRMPVTDCVGMATVLPLKIAENVVTIFFLSLSLSLSCETHVFWIILHLYNDVYNDVYNDDNDVYLTLSNLTFDRSQVKIR